jgi:hypothetical protein
MAKSKYFTTSDGQEFYTENHAHNHAKTLKDKAVKAPGNKKPVEEIEVNAESVELTKEAFEATAVDAFEPVVKTPVIDLAESTKEAVEATTVDAVEPVVETPVIDLVESTKETVETPAIEAKKTNQPNNKK